VKISGFDRVWDWDFMVFEKKGLHNVKHKKICVFQSLGFEILKVLAMILIEFLELVNLNKPIWAWRRNPKVCRQNPSIKHFLWKKKPEKEWHQDEDVDKVAYEWNMSKYQEGVNIPLKKIGILYLSYLNITIVVILTNS